MTTVHIIGAGLAGSEASWQLAERGIDVVLYEMRPVVGTAVHHTGDFAELVCSNSFKSTNEESAAGLLKWELQRAGSLLIELAYKHRVPAGGALALNRGEFAAEVTALLEQHPHIKVVRGEVERLPLEFCEAGDYLIVAAGPLASDALAADIARIVGADELAFFDAAAPIVAAESLDTDKLFYQSRYDKGDTCDYLNAAMTREEYDAFISELLAAKRVIARDFEGADLFKACQPIEEVARTGHDALRFGALKPVGITAPGSTERPHAVVQLRSENRERSAFNLVGFQTNLTFGEQQRVFRMVPGLENAEFLRYGVMHRNTFIDAPRLLDSSLALKGMPHLRFAGQITGTEGYCEAIASGMYAALCTYAEIAGLQALELPRNAAFGALVHYATDPETIEYQPMHVNFGLVEPFGYKMKKIERYAAYAARSKKEYEAFLDSRADLFGVRDE